MLMAMSQKAGEPSVFDDAFWRIYITGPLTGGMVAGLVSWAHAHFLALYAKEDGEEQSDDDQERLLDLK